MKRNKARALHGVLILMLMLGLMVIPGLLTDTACAANGTMTGNGSTVDPYKIEDYADLKAFAKKVNDSGQTSACAELMGDIDASAGAWTPIMGYSGTFDGKGCRIKGLSTPADYDINYAGLFGTIRASGKVRNVGLEGGHISGRAYVGSIAGYTEGTNVIVERCYNTGTVTGKSVVGGIVGIVGGGKVENCYNTGAVYGTSDGENDDPGLTENFVGGLVGYLSSSSVLRNCYTAGSISVKNDDTFVSAVVGTAIESTIDRVYFDKSIQSNYIEGRYYQMALVGIFDLTTDQMTGKDALIQMNFTYDESDTFPWMAKENDNGIHYYPHLKGFDRDSDGGQLLPEDIPSKDWPAKVHIHIVDNKAVYFEPWNDDDSLPDSSGSYYLTGDVTMTSTWKPSGTVNLCLNDHSITGNASRRVITFDNESVALNLYDCAATTRYYYIDDDGLGHIAASASDANYVNAAADRRGTFRGGFITGGYAETGGGVLVDNSSSFTMNGGTIIGNWASDGGGVYVDNSSSFTMNGGSSIGNQANYGGGVYVDTGSSFTMNGGSIIGNLARSGGGVLVYYNSEFTMNGGSVTGNRAILSEACGGVGIGYGARAFSLSGAPAVIGNKSGTNGAADDVRMGEGKTITITGKLQLPDGASEPQIGVAISSSTGEIAAGAFTDGYSSNQNTDDPGKYFFSNDDSYIVSFNENKTEAQLADVVTVEGVSSLTGEDSLTYGYEAGSASIRVTAETASGFEAGYQWYSCNAQGGDETAIDTTKEPTAATAEYAIPPGKNAGDHHYFCRVTATRADGKTASADSGVAAVTVKKASLTIKVKDQTYHYYGMPHGEGDTAYDGTAVIAEKIETVGLQNGDEITSLVIDGAETEIGVYEDRIEITGFQINDLAAAKDNYDITLVPGKLTIDTGIAEIAAVPAATAITYGQSLADSGLSGGKAVIDGTETELAGTFSWSDASIRPSVSDSGRTGYAVTFTPDDTTHYGTAPAKVTVAVNRADITPSVSIEGWSYGSAANQPVVSGNTGGGAESFLYKEKGAPDSAYSADVPTDAGSYTVLAQIGQTENYNAGTATTDMTISPAEMQVTSAGYEGTYDGAAHSITVNAPAGAKVTYAEAGGAFTEEIPSFTDAGEYTVEFRVAQKNYSEYAGNQQVKISPAAITIRADDRSSEYGKDLQELTYTVGGAYVKGDDLGVVLSTDAKKDVPGTYPIRVSWNGNPNYEAALTDGTYSVGDVPPDPPKPEPAKVSGTLLTKMTAKGSRSLVLTWSRIEGADGYDVFFAICKNNMKYKKVKSFEGNSTFKWTKKKLKKGTSYKAYVKAWIMKDGRKTYVRTGLMVHAYTSGGSRLYTNPKSVTVNKKSVVLKTGESSTIKARVNKLQKGKKLTPKKHVKTLRYLSSDPRVATVSGNGRITAAGKGECSVYVYAPNGVKKTVNVTVVE